jgi:transposase
MQMARRKKKTKKNNRAWQTLKTIQPDSAGIDLGSQEHWVAGPPHPDRTANVERFGTTTPELFRLVRWLKDQGVKTVAMESTGVYWIPVFEILGSHQFEVVLVNARQIRHVPGRKTDMLDCQWIQRLHACGLLRGSFRPADDICRLRSMIRERNMIVEQRSDWLRRMQKSLDQMNVLVHHSVSDISGVTGMAIIRAIVNGERNPQTLARLRDSRCRKSESQIAEFLTGNWRAEHLFNLRQSLRMYDHICDTIAEYDKEILSYLAQLQPNDNIEVPPPITKAKAKSIAKRGHEPMRQALFRLCGYDLTTIDGIGIDTASIVISELGLNFSSFGTERQFISYLRLAPNLSISAGKKVRDKLKATTSTRVSTALRMAATTLRNSQTALGAYYRRIAYRKGASVAVFATARKLAQLIYRLVRYGQAYVDIGVEAYEKRFTHKRLKSYTNALRKMGFSVQPLTLGEPNPI